MPPHPYLLRDVTLTAFAFRVDPVRVAALCDRQLNQPTAGRFHYRPALPFAVAYFASSPATEPADRRGSTPEQELAIWLPLRADAPRRSVWFCPYIFVDGAYPLVSGREIYGFPKSLARFTIPRAHEPPQRFVAEATGWSPWGENAPPSRVDVLEVLARGPCSRTVDVATSAGGRRTPVTSLFAGLLADGLARLGSSTKAVALKQFRDVEDPARACYQAVVEAGFHVPRVYEAGRLRGDYVIRVAPSTSYPIIEELGLPSHGEVAARAAIWLRFDVESRRGTAYGSA